MNGLNKRGDNSMLMQLRKLSTFATFEMQQVSLIWKRFDLLLNYSFALTNVLLDWNWSTFQGRKIPSVSWNEKVFSNWIDYHLHMKMIHMGNLMTTILWWIFHCFRHIQSSCYASASAGILCSMVYNECCCNLEFNGGTLQIFCNLPSFCHFKRIARKAGITVR